MCDERERLIGYVYDECGDADRRAISAHLDECATCRQEISGFRRVRQDLLAWDVPPHDSVWRPFAPARVEPWWRAVPAWAMAAAAAAMFAVGAAGGVVTHALVPYADDVVAEAVPVPAGTVLPPAALEALEARVLALVRSEVASRVVAPAAGAAAFDFSAAEARLLQLMRAELRDADARQVERLVGIEQFLNAVGSDLAQTSRNMNDLENRVRMVTFEQAGLPGGGR